MDRGQDGGEERRSRLSEGGKNGGAKKSGSEETGEKREWGESGVPAVVEMSATTGAAEMERDAQNGEGGEKQGGEKEMEGARGGRDGRQEDRKQKEAEEPRREQRILGEIKVCGTPRPSPPPGHHPHYTLPTCSPPSAPLLSLLAPAGLTRARRCCHGNS